MDYQYEIASPQISDLLRFGQSISIEELCLPRSIGIEWAERLNVMGERKRRLRKGEILFCQGYGLHAIYIVISGLISTAISDGEGRKQITGFYFSSELVGLDALHGREHVCTATAITPSTVYVIPIHRLEELSIKNPAIRDVFTRLLSKTVAEHEQLLMLVNQRSAIDRMAILIFSFACRIGRNGHPAIDMSLDISRSDIANYLGVAKETASRAISELKSMRIIDGRGKRVHIVDLKRLMEMISGGRAESSYSG